ncbi:MAG: hypothetical protein PHH82_00785 [Candidatus ainarchaeum sp.]|nr:hypothetical protein [Candidatus ainarchaeum sp.]
MHTPVPHHHPIVVRHLMKEQSVLAALAQRKKAKGLVAEHEEIRAGDIRGSLVSTELRGHAREVIRRRLTDVKEELGQIVSELNAIKSRGVEQERKRYEDLAARYKNLKSFDEHVRELLGKQKTLDKEMQILSAALK